MDPATDYHVPDFTLNPNATCRCDNFRYSCDRGSPVAPPRERITTTKDILQNLEGRNIENYLFESFDDFIEKRFVQNFNTFNSAFLNIHHFSYSVNDVCLLHLQHLVYTNYADQIAPKGAVRSVSMFALWT